MTMASSPHLQPRPPQPPLWLVLLLVIMALLLLSLSLLGGSPRLRITTALPLLSRLFETPPLPQLPPRNPFLKINLNQINQQQGARLLLLLYKGPHNLQPGTPVRVNPGRSGLNLA